LARLVVDTIQGPTPNERTERPTPDGPGSVNAAMTA
jgi:hypothetical protein